MAGLSIVRIARSIVAKIKKNFFDLFKKQQIRIIDNNLFIKLLNYFNNNKYNNLTLMLGIPRLFIISLNEVHNGVMPIIDETGLELIILKSSMSEDSIGRYIRLCQFIQLYKSIIDGLIDLYNFISRYGSIILDNVLEPIKGIANLFDTERPSADAPTGSSGDSGGSFDGYDSSPEPQSQNNPSNNTNNNPDNEQNNSENEDNQNGEPSTQQQNPVELEDGDNQNEPRTPEPNPDNKPEDDHTRAPKKPKATQSPSDHSITPPVFDLPRSRSSSGSNRQHPSNSNALGLTFNGEGPSLNQSQIISPPSSPSSSISDFSDLYVDDFDFGYLSTIEEVTESSGSSSPSSSSTSSSSLSPKSE